MLKGKKLHKQCLPKPMERYSCLDPSNHTVIQVHIYGKQEHFSTYSAIFRDATEHIKKALKTTTYLDNNKILKTPLAYKAIPLQSWTGPEGPRRLRLQDFKTIDT